MKKIFLLLPFILVHCVYSQKIEKYDPISIQSPNAGSLGVFGEVPVSFFTGNINLTVPLYTLKTNSFELPLYLAYHSAGVRPEEYPSWVGLNWTLFAGGQITRIVNGYPDEADKKYNQDAADYDALNKGGLGFMYSYSFLDNNNWEIFADVIADISIANYDSRPDEFRFTVNGISGKFFLDHNGNWQVQCNQPIKVLLEPESEDIQLLVKPQFNFEGNSIFRIQLIDAQGVRYVFGNKTEAIEYTRPNTGVSIPTSTTWNITKIVHPNGEEINFNYIRGNIIAKYGYNYTNNASSDYTNYPLLWANFFCSNTSSNINYSQNIIETSYLESIETVKEKIYFYSAQVNDLPVNPMNDYDQKNFSDDENPGNSGYPDIMKYHYDETKEDDNGYPIDYNKFPSKFDNTEIKYAWETDLTRRKKLNKIAIFNLDVNELQIPTRDYVEDPESLSFISAYKIIDFSYIEGSYDILGDFRERQKLQKIEIYSPNSPDQIIPYYFHYYDNPDVNLPDYNSIKIDHWGYFNETSSLLSTVEIEGDNNYYSLREPTNNIDVLTEGMLKEIIYPTGGKTTFIYEQHDYAKFLERIPFQNGELNPNYDYPLSDIDVGIEASDKPAGGLRIRSIISSPDGIGSNSTITRNYYYTEDYLNNNTTSSGMLMYRPKYYWHNIRYYDDELESLKKHFSSHSKYPLSVEGTHIGYSEVTEVVSSEDENGAIVYKYTLPQKRPEGVTGYMQYQDIIPLGQVGNGSVGDVIDMSLERGKLKSKTIYDALFEPIEKVEYTYNSDPNRLVNHSVRTRQRQAVNHCNQNLVYNTLGSSVLIPTYDFYLESEKTTHFKDGVEIFSQTVDYEYSNRLLSKKTLDNSKGGYYNTYFSYPLDYYIIAPNFSANDIIDEQSRAIAEMVRNHILKKPIEITETLQEGSDEEIVSATLNFYKYEDFGGKWIIVPSKIEQLEITSPFDYDPTFSPSSISINPINSNTAFQYTFLRPFEYKPKIQFDQYDNTGNLIQLHQTNGMNLSYVYDFDKLYPIAKVENASHNEVFFDGFEDIENWDNWWTWHPAQNIIQTQYHTGKKSLRLINNTDSEIFYFTPELILNNSSSKKYTASCWVKSDGPDAQLYLLYSDTEIEMDYQGYSSAQNTSIDSWEYIEVELEVPANTNSIFARLGKNSNGTVYFDNVRILPSDAHMTNYTFDRMDGLTSELDPANRAVFYEYDNLGRLTEILDKDKSIIEKYNYNFTNNTPPPSPTYYNISGTVVDNNDNPLPNATLLAGGEEVGINLAGAYFITRPEGWNDQITVSLEGYNFQPANYDFSFGLDLDFSDRTFVGTPISHNLTVTHNGNGTVAPGTSSVYYGSDVDFTFTPNSGYYVESVTINGELELEEVTEYTYTNVRDDVTIDVVFTELDFLNVSTQFIGFLLDDEPKTFNITSNLAWTISISEGDTDWINVDQTSGIGNAIISVSVPTVYNSTTNRTGTITITAGSLSQTIDIQQANIMY